MKLAIKKDGGELQGMGGYHYNLVPFPMESDTAAELWAAMGYEIVEVDPAKGSRLLQDAGRAMAHELEIAFLVDGNKPKGGA